MEALRTDKRQNKKWFTRISKNDAKNRDETQKIDWGNFILNGEHSKAENVKVN